MQSLVAQAMAEKVCVSPMYKGPAFVIVHPEGPFYVEQTTFALEKLLKFLERNGIPEDSVAVGA